MGGGGKNAEVGRKVGLLNSKNEMIYKNRKSRMDKK
jgi:hypothetical protein